MLPRPVPGRNISLVDVSVASDLSDVSFLDDIPFFATPAATAPLSLCAVPMDDRWDGIKVHNEYFYPNGDVRFLVSS